VSTRRWVLDDAAAEWAEWGVGRPEGAENGGGGGICSLGDELVGNFIDESAYMSVFISREPQYLVLTIPDQ
jgi:hypothetical protein